MRVGLSIVMKTPPVWGPSAASLTRREPPSVKVPSFRSENYGPGGSPYFLPGRVWKLPDAGLRLAAETRVIEQRSYR